MTQSTLLYLMGVTHIGNYTTANANWKDVELRLRTHPNEVFISHVPLNGFHPFSPLYIVLRNEINPVPFPVVDIILRINPDSLTDDLIVVACRNPHTSREITLRLLEMRPNFARQKYQFWCTPLHAIAKSAQSVEAVKVLINAHSNGLIMKDCHGRIPLFDACCEGSFQIVEVLIEEGKQYGLLAGGLFEVDDRGVTPFHSAVSRMVFFNDCRTFQHIYVNSNDFTAKCIDSWRKLVICVLCASNKSRSAWQKSSSKVLFAAIELARLSKTGILRNQHQSAPIQLDWDQVLRLLLNPRYCDPEQLASTIDDNGMLPFQIAIENNITIQDGLLHILYAYPEAVFRDFSVVLIPQMMAALGKESRLKVMFSLFTNAPFILRNVRFDYDERCAHGQEVQ